MWSPPPPQQAPHLAFLEGDPGSAPADGSGIMRQLQADAIPFQARSPFVAIAGKGDTFETQVFVPGMVAKTPVGIRTICSVAFKAPEFLTIWWTRSGFRSRVYFESFF